MQASIQKHDHLIELVRDEGLDTYKYSDRLNQFTELLPDDVSEDWTVLEVGTGTGYFSIYLLLEHGCDTYGVDLPNDESLENQNAQQRWIARMEDVGIEFQYCDIVNEPLPFDDDTFDLLVFTEVLEHLVTAHPPVEVFEEFHRVLTDSGTLILSTPNLASIDKRIKLLLGYPPITIGFGKEETYQRHQREYTRRELERMLDWAGFTNETFLFGEQRPEPELFFDPNSVLDYVSLKIAGFYPPFRNTVHVKATA
ncbi:class I SAM-dependent methyltransferase [Haladaptatus sp. NG-SE-30]